MNGTLAQNLRRGAATINQAAAEVVAYRRGTQNTTLRARPTDASYPSQANSAMTEQWSGKDWVATPDEWNRTHMSKPARGDVIFRPTAAGIETYELVAPPGMQIFNYTTFGEYILLHSQLVPTT